MSKTKNNGFVKLTDEDLETAKINGFEDYLHGAEIGDYVYDDNEMLVSYSCVYQWQATTPPDRDSYKKWGNILDRLDELNNITYGRK